MGLLSYLLRKLMGRPIWNGTPEMFLAMVLYMQKKNNPVYVKREVLQLGEIMMKVIKVKLLPFSNFAELLEKGTPDYSEALVAVPG